MNPYEYVMDAVVHTVLLFGALGLGFAVLGAIGHFLKSRKERGYNDEV